jgi:6-phosphogluconolactonase
MIGGASPAAEPAVGTSTRVEIFADATARTLATAHLFVRLAQEAVVRRGWFTVALSGGSTPRDLYLLLATDRYFRATVPWSKIQFFFGDERPVPPNHAESNYRMVNEAMFARLPPGLAHVYRINGELQYASEAALDYETEMRGFFGPHGLMEAGFPRFDLVFLGLGIDGHTASLFPGSPALREKDSWVVSNWVERLKSHRITMTYPVLNSAREVVLLVGGAEKAPIVAAVLGKTSAAPLYPVQAVKLWNGTKRWMLDQAAAARLPAVEIIADPTKSETVGAMAALPSTS